MNLILLFIFSITYICSDLAYIIHDILSAYGLFEQDMPLRVFIDILQDFMFPIVDFLQALIFLYIFYNQSKRNERTS